MARDLPLRMDYNREAVRALARRASDGKQARRLLALFHAFLSIFQQNRFA
jgi:hypothetical protein